MTFQFRKGICNHFLSEYYWRLFLPCTVQLPSRFFLWSLYQWYSWKVKQMAQCFISFPLSSLFLYTQMNKGDSCFILRTNIDSDVKWYYFLVRVKATDFIYCNNCFYCLNINFSHRLLAWVIATSDDGTLFGEFRNLDEVEMEIRDLEDCTCLPLSSLHISWFLMWLNDLFLQTFLMFHGPRFKLFSRRNKIWHLILLYTYSSI